MDLYTLAAGSGASSLLGSLGLTQVWHRDILLGGTGRRCRRKLSRLPLPPLGGLWPTVLLLLLNHLPKQSKKMTSTLIYKNGKYHLQHTSFFYM